MDKDKVFYSNLGMLIINVVILMVTITVSYYVFKLTQFKNTRINIIFISMNMALIICGITQSCEIYFSRLESNSDTERIMIEILYFMSWFANGFSGAACLNNWAYYLIMAQ